MPDSAERPRRKPHFTRWLLIYALFVAYSSTVIGPGGLNFVPLAPADAWREFCARALTWVNLPSDQRADWMGNLIMMVPFGFLVAGSLWARRREPQPVLAFAIETSAALAFALGFVLALKFAQVLFPPRTVMLNYVVAQTLGAAIGIATFRLVNRFRLRVAWRGSADPRAVLRMVLKAYAVAWFVFVLMPLDFVASRADLMGQVEKLPLIVRTVPGAERPLTVQVALLAAAALAAVPFGMLLTLGRYARHRPLADALVRGIVWMLGLLLTSALVISAAPSLVALALRLAGVTIGAWALGWLLDQDVERLLYRLRRLSAWVWGPYLVLLFAVNGLFSLDWTSPAQAARLANPLGLLPLFDYYIVSKAAAARNIVAHALMYAPIGALAWLNGVAAGRAAAGAVVLALCIEAARYLRPGLEGDVNAVAVAGLAAFITARAMPALWAVFRRIARPAG